MYRIDRIIPGFRDSLMVLWEGNDLPTFARSNPYLFDDKSVADRVAQRLAAKCSETMATPHFPAKPITYEVVAVLPPHITNAKYVNIGGRSYPLVKVNFCGTGLYSASFIECERTSVGWFHEGQFCETPIPATECVRQGC